ncbi:MAG: sulfotransferase [Gammaproteobacteria bacterium]|nr:sulfotransferase [Gammaproteobacteria bacterium]
MSKKNVLTRSKKIKVEELLNRNQLAEACTLCNQVCQIDRTDTDAWILLGLIERKLGHFTEAEQAARRALTLRPNFAPAIQLLGTALQCQNHFQEAINCYRNALELQPNVAETHYLLGNALREIGAYVDAAASYARAIELQPDYLAALSNCGAVLLAMGNRDQAAIYLHRANELQPGLPQVLCNLALLRQAQGDYDEAKAYCRDAQHRDPNFLDAIAMLGDLYEKSSQHDEAKAWVKRGLEIDPDSLSLNMTAARLDRHDGRSDEAIARLEHLRTKTHEEAQQDILLLLGQLYDKKKDAARAFFCLTEGNRLKAKAMLADVEESEHYLKHIETLRQRFRTDHPETWQPFADDDFTDNPIFLFGFPRSGTTLLEQILDSHPRLQAIPEKPTIAAVEQALQGRQLSALTLDDVRKLRKVYFDTAARYVQRDPNRVYVDKQPLNTVEVQLIWRLFPNAKCILAIRHPCDATFSCFMQNFVINNAMSTFFTLEKTAEAYAGVMSLWREYIAVLPVNYHRLRYEDLVADQAGETRRLLDFLGLEWNENVLRQDAHARTRNISTPSYHQVTQPIYQDAKYRWKRYEEYMAPVLPVLQPYIDYFGYGGS